MGKIVANFAVDSLRTFTLNFTLSLRMKKEISRRIVFMNFVYTWNYTAARFF